MSSTLYTAVVKLVFLLRRVLQGVLQRSTKPLHLSHIGGYCDGHKLQRFHRVFEREQAKQ